MEGRRSSTLSPRKLIEKTRHHLQSPSSFQDSVDEANLINIDYKANPWWKARYSCWEVKGSIAEVYKILGPKICDELRRSCRESSLEVFVWPYMVGKSPKTARPVLVIASEDEASREEAKVAIEYSDLLEHHRYFKLWPLRYLPTGPINPVAMDGHAPAQILKSFEVYFDPAEPLRPIGMPIYTRAGGGALRRATANAVYADAEYGYLTAAHAFSETGLVVTPTAGSQTCFDFPFDTDSDSEGSDSVGFEASSLYSGTSPGATGSGSASASSSYSSELSIFHESKVQDDSIGSINETAALQNSTADSSMDQHPQTELELLGFTSVSYEQLDCAVVVVTNFLVRGFFARLESAKQSWQEIVQVSETRRANVTVLTSRGPLRGSILDLPMYMRLPGSGLVQTLFRIKYDGTIMMGDCGSLVIDHETKEVYGHVVANSRRRGIAFMIPAEPVFKILESEGGWELLTLHASEDFHTDDALNTDTEMTTDTAIPSSTEHWQDLVAWDGESEFLNQLVDWDFKRSQPRDIPRRNDSEHLVHHEEFSKTTGESFIPHQVMSMAPSTIESLSSRGSVSWYLESPTYAMTAPSSLGDIDELEQFETIDIESDVEDLSQQSGNPAFSKRLDLNRPVPRESSRSQAGRTAYHDDSKYGTQSASSDRIPRGRKKGLTASRRNQAAMMRIIGSCSNCQRRKEKCDPGTPCRSCLNHYKEDLVYHPCRDRLLSDLSTVFLDESLDWHPRSLSIASSTAFDKYKIDNTGTYFIPIIIGFGPTIRLAVHGLEHQGFGVTHEHIVYVWPPGTSDSLEKHTNIVLPAVLTPDTDMNLQYLLDQHFKSLVLNDFRQFPLYTSPLRVLREIYVFYRSMVDGSAHSRLLLKALTLLVLVHVGGDISVPGPTTDTGLENLVRTTMKACDLARSPTPCFIRAQVGSAMGILGVRLMKEILSSLELLLLGRDPDAWPAALATLLIVLMAVESIQYHAAKQPYHESSDPLMPQDLHRKVERMEDEAVKSLLEFYLACFRGCHPSLHMSDESYLMRELASSPGKTFIESIRSAVRRAESAGYLKRKANEQKWDGEDMNFFFDRLIARVLLASM